MNQKVNPVIAMTRAAIAAGEPLEVRKIRAMREASKKMVSIFTAVFWAGIVVFNVVLWVPLPIPINPAVLYAAAAVVLLVAVVVPILGLRRHKLILELLKVNKEPLKKKTANASGRVYIDKVKLSERPFINAEYEVLSGSKWQK